MLSFINIASGSKGNATLIYNEDSLLLVDMGVTKRSLMAALKKIGRQYKDIQGVLITHEHHDHIGTLGLLHDDFPVFSAPGVVSGPLHANVFPEEPFDLGSFLIYPIEASHDAKFPLGYVFCSNNERLVYLTDTGVVMESALPYMANADYYIIESNHDEKMLKSSKRPLSLILRILSPEGHLSNRDSALCMAAILGPKTKAIYLAHLSEECNTVEKAYETYSSVFEEKQIDFDFNKIIALAQRHMTMGGDEE